MTSKYSILTKARLYCSYIVLSIVCASTLFSSCRKNILDTEPLGSFSDPAVWKDEALIGTFVSNTYRIMPHDFRYSAALGMGCVTDELFKRGGSADFINSGNITPSNLGLLNYWNNDVNAAGVGQGTAYWPAITKCNLFFDRIESSPVAQAAKNQMSGEMKFLRAFAYFNLISLYGGVPLITKPFALTDDFNVPRDSYENCLKFVVDELDAAAALLPVEYAAKDQGKITKGAALAAKARALLYDASPLHNPGNDQAKWQKAADAAKAVIDLNKYSLYSNYASLFFRGNSYNSEVIWSRPFDRLADPETTYLDLSLYPNGYNGFGQVHPLQNLVDDYEMTNGELPVLGYNSNGSQIINPDAGYDPQNPYVNRDPRFYATILFDGAPFKGRAVETFLPGGMDSNEGPLSAWNATLTGYYVRKFLDETTTNPSGNNHSSVPYIYFRYAEVLLNYAEAMYNLGDEPTCRQYLNMIRSRPGVGMPDITESGPALMERMINERRIELVFEGHRYFDVRRWKIAPQVLNIPGKKVSIQKTGSTRTFTVSDFNPRVFTDKNYLIPVPQSEIEKNSLLVQNPGYN